MPFSPTPLSRSAFRHQESRYQKKQTKQYVEQQRAIKALAQADQATTQIRPAQNNQVSETKKLRLDNSITTLQQPLAISDLAITATQTRPHFTLAQQYLLLWHILTNTPSSQAYLRGNHSLPSKEAPTNPRAAEHSPSRGSRHTANDPSDLLANVSQYAPTILSRIPRSTHQLLLSDSLPLDQLTQMTRQDPDNLNNCLPASQSYYRINKRLTEWVKDTAIQSINSPTDALGAVLNHYDALISDDFFASFDICTLDQIDLRYIDEAALLYHHLQQSPDGVIDTNINKVRIDNMQSVRKHFLQKLISDLQRETLLEKILTPIVNNKKVDIYFDGIAIQNAFGKTIDDLLLSDAVQQIPDFKTLSLTTQRTLLQEKFTRISENFDYPIGTAAQSLASVIQRVSAYQGNHQIKKYANEKALLEDFKQLENTWVSQRQYPLHPRLLFALHLADASGVKIYARNWQEAYFKDNFSTVFHNLIKEIELLNPDQAQKAWTWRAEFFSYWNKNGKKLFEQDQTTQRDAIQHFFSYLQKIAYTYYQDSSSAQLKSQYEHQQYTDPDPNNQYKTSVERIADKRKKLNALHNLHQLVTDHFNFAAGHRYRQMKSHDQIKQQRQQLRNEIRGIAREIKTQQYAALPSGRPPPAIILLAKQLTETIFKAEFVVADDWQARAAGLMQYASDRLIANYGNAPQFSRAKAAREILMKHGMDEDMIDNEHRYTLETENIHIQSPKWGTYIDEFLDRADWNSLLGKQLTLRNNNQQRQTIDAEEALQLAEEEWNKQLYQHPWVQARARENCRLKQKPTHPIVVNTEAQRIANDYRAETETHRHLMIGLETWVNTVPVIGPIYNIEEGIRHQDVTQTLLGTLFLGLDSLDLMAVGARKGIALKQSPDLPILKTPASEFSAINTLYKTADTLDLPISHFVEEDNIGKGLNLNPDPWEIKQIDADIPYPYRALAQRLRAGETNVMWQAPTGEVYPLVHIRNEDRIIPVKHSGGSYHEVSWQKGTIIRQAKLIQYDRTTRTYHTHLKLIGGGRESIPSADTRIQGIKLRDRYTVQKISSILREASSTSNVKMAAENLFVRIFPVTAIGKAAKELENFSMHDFYKKIYEKSPTFRRLANHFFDTNTEKWQITINDESNRPYVDFFDITRRGYKNIAIPTTEKIDQLQYLGLTAWHTYTREQVYLDAIIQAFTGLTDYGTPVILNSRGPNIAFRDRILFEASYVLPQQISFPKVTISERATEKYHSFHPNPEAGRDSAIEALPLENRYLDPLFDRKIDWNSDTILLGTPLDKRSTIQEIKEIRAMRKEANVPITFPEDFLSKFKLSFKFSVGEDLNSIEEIEDFYHTIYSKSPTFHKHWILMSVKQELKASSESELWTFITSKKTAAQFLPSTHLYSDIDFVNKKIYILSDDLYYLSEQGFTKLEQERKLIHQLLCVITGYRGLTQGVWTNRGAIVYLTDKILEEGKYDIPRRLAYGLVSGQQIQSSQFPGNMNPLEYKTSMRRASDIEDLYLKTRAFKRSPRTPS